MKNSAKYVTTAALIASLYVALTHLANAVGLASGVIQFRLSEVLTVLPFFTPAAIPGLTVGCLIANLTTGGMPLDVVFGTFATFLGAVGTYLFRKKSKFLAPVFPILANTIIVPFVLKFVYLFDGTIPYFALTVFIGEFVMCGFIGVAFMQIIEATGIFKKNDDEKLNETAETQDKSE